MNHIEAAWTLPDSPNKTVILQHLAGKPKPQLKMITDPIKWLTSALPTTTEVARPWLDYVHSDGEYCYACNGPSIHRLHKTILPGVYDKNLNPVVNGNLKNIERLSDCFNRIQITSSDYGKSDLIVRDDLIVWGDFNAIDRVITLSVDSGVIAKFNQKYWAKQPLNAAWRYRDNRVHFIDYACEAIIMGIRI